MLFVLRLQAMLESVKHTIVLLQICKVSDSQLSLNDKVVYHHFLVRVTRGQAMGIVMVDLRLDRAQEIAKAAAPLILRLKMVS